MGFWQVVAAVLVAMVILNVIGGICKAISKWLDKKIAEDQLNEIHRLADFIVKNSKK